ncbi:MAG: CpsB/CapC family capsule biosynthesis tyrosine phosphatase [Gemmatimonadaceae bacterium]
MIDLHTHLLPGVDDGSPTLEHSAMVLARFATDGVRGVACTPHLSASDSVTAPVEEYAALRAQLQELAPEGLILYGGWEIMLDAPGKLHRTPGLSLGSSNAVLVEWPRATVPDWGTVELSRLRGNGFIPLVAHVERYRGISLELVRQWRALGAVVQTDATILVAGGDKCEFAKMMLREGLVDILASDNHGDRRTLGMAHWWLTEIGAPDQAALLTDTNPERLLQDQEMLPVAGIVFEHGMFDRLRAWWRSRRTESVPNGSING